MLILKLYCENFDFLIFFSAVIQGPISLGTLILANFLLGGLLGVGLLGTAIQGCLTRVEGTLSRAPGIRKNKKMNPKTLFFTFSYISYLQN